MKHKINYVLLDDGFWESTIRVFNKDGYEQGKVVLVAVNRIYKNTLLEYKRHMLVAIRARSRRVE